MRQSLRKIVRPTGIMLALTMVFSSGVLAEDKTDLNKLDTLNSKPPVITSEKLSELKICDIQTMPTIKIAAGGTYKYEPQIVPNNMTPTQGFSVRLENSDPKVEVKVLPSLHNQVKFGIWTTLKARPGNNIVVIEYVARKNKGCEGKKNVVMIPLTITKPAVASHKELLRLETKGITGLDTYHHRDFISNKTKAGARLTSTRMVRNDLLRGTLQVRDLASLPSQSIADTKFYITPEGNVIRTANIARHNEVPLQAYFTYHPGAPGTFGIDADQDGDFDLLLGGTTDLTRGLSRDWILTTPLGEQLYSCLRAGRTITPKLLSGMIDASGRGGIACPMPGGSSDGGRGGFLPPAGRLSDPNCSSSNGFGPGGMVSDEPEVPEDPETPPADNPPPDEETDTEDAPDINISPVATIQEQIERENEAARLGFTSESNPSATVPNAQAGNLANIIGWIKEHIDFEPIKRTIMPLDRLPDEGDLIQENQARDRQAPGIDPIPDDSGTSSGPFEDPRCRQQEQSPGNGYFDPYACLGNNLTDCILKQTDPVYNVTGGRCRSIDGQAGGKTLECQSNQDMENRDCRPDENPHCANQCSPSDRSNRCVDSVLTPPDGSAGDYISVIGAGAVFGGLCHADGPNCPGSSMPSLEFPGLNRME